MKRRSSALRDLFKTPEQKTYGLIAATIATVALFFFLAIRPAYTKIVELNEDIDEKQQLLNEMEQKRENLRFLREEKSKIEDDLGKFEVAFPAVAESGFLIANFAGMAEENDLVLSSVEFKDELDRAITDDYDAFEHLGSITFIQVQLDLSGDLSDMIAFLEDMENFPRPIDVKNFSYQKNTAIDSVLESGGEESVFYPYSASARVVVFYSSDTITEELFVEL